MAPILLVCNRCSHHDKLSSKFSLTQTMIHEATHLYYHLTFGADPPSWVAEGMATYFEGFSLRKGGALAFDHLPRDRLRRLQEALGGRRLIPLREFLALDAATLIDRDPERALDFYAQAWGYFYFFKTSPNPAYRAAFEHYTQSLRAGRRPSLSKLLGGNLDQVEAEFARFMRVL